MDYVEQGQGQGSVMAYFNELRTDTSKADAQFTIQKIAENPLNKSGMGIFNYQKLAWDAAA